MSPEKMIKLVMSGKDSDFSQELWSAFENGFPIENLRPLLVSDDQKVLGLGTYLIYELGEKVRCLLEDIVPLLGNENPQIRGDAVIALGECATKFDTLALGKIIELLADTDPFVQRIVMRFIQSCERNMLNVGVFKAAEMNPNTTFSELPKYLTETIFHLRSDAPVSAQTLEKLLSHSNPIAIRFGVGLATRPRQIVDETFIDMAIHIEDEECRNVLKWSQERPCLTYAENMKL
jgi:hypothetical protein